MPRILLCLALGSLLQNTSPLSPAQPPRDTRVAADERTATLRGRVTAADTGRPLRGVVVRASTANPRGGPLEARVATTDAQGRYEFAELAAGRYSLMASKGGWVTLAYGQLRPFESGQSLEIGKGQAVERVDFALPPGSVMAGRVLDEVGDPVVGLTVTAMRLQYMQGRRQLTPVTSTTTNDLGEYRLYGLAPGQYYVSAAQRGGVPTLFDGRPPAGNPSYVPTYYPATPSPAEALALTLGVGKTISEINISIVAARTARVSGTAVTSDGKPMAGASLSLGQATSGGGYFASGVGTVQPDGSFVIFNLAPGEYTLGAAPSSARGSFGGVITPSSDEGASITFTVTGEDITDLRLVGVKRITITGKVLVDGAQASPRVNLSGWRVSTSSVQPDDRGGFSSSEIKEEGTFELNVRPGKLVFNVFSFAGGTPGPVLKAVRWRGMDITDTGAEFRPGEDATDVDIELTNRRTDLSGLVTDSHGAPATNHTVVVFARDRERWRYNSRYQATGRLDQNGRFRIRGLPAGDYYAVALEYLEPGQASDPEFLDRVRQKATTFSLGEGESKVIDLMMQPAGRG